ncbi:Unknown protein sequence [Pseudomonas amygdali pv. myricae]|nr:Unknown protein sequence [Pseudomonas amygdali pv. myricae]
MPIDEHFYGAGTVISAGKARCTHEWLGYEKKQGIEGRESID